MKVKDLKNLLSKFNDEDVVVVEVHDTVLYEDLYDFSVDHIKMYEGNTAVGTEVRFCPKNHREEDYDNPSYL